MGEKYSGIKPRGPLQHFQQLKSEYLAKGGLFEDPQFQPDQIDVGSKWDRHLEKIRWLRPKVSINKSTKVENVSKSSKDQSIEIFELNRI